MNGEYFGVRVSDGKILWRVISRKNGGASFGSGAVSGNYVVFGSRNKSIFCLDRETGTTRWVFRTRGEVDSSPVIAGSRVFVGCDDGAVYGLNLSDGKQIWKFTAGSRIASSPAFGEKGTRMVIGADDGAVYCFGR